MDNAFTIYNHKTSKQKSANILNKICNEKYEDSSINSTQKGQDKVQGQVIF